MGLLYNETKTECKANKMDGRQNFRDRNSCMRGLDQEVYGIRGINGKLAGVNEVKVPKLIRAEMEKEFAIQKHQI